MTDFAYESPIDVRFRDLDPMGHVNHAAYVSYCEQARIDYFTDALGLDADELGMVVAHLDIDYERSVTFEDDVVVALRVPSLGTTSFPIEYEVRTDDGTVAARAETVQVAVDEESGEPKALPDAWRQKLLDGEAAQPRSIDAN